MLIAFKKEPDSSKMAKVVLIIQARMSSTRLPSKSMMPLADKPLVYRMVERLKNCKKIDEIVIATSDQSEDQVLVELAKELDVSSFQGNLLDVRDRYLKAAEKFQADFVIRIPADNPMPDANEIDKLIEFHLGNNSSGFSSNLAQVNNSEYLDGIGAEIFSTKLLQESVARSSSDTAKEHVHRNFFDYSTQTPVDSSWCPIASPKAPAELRRPDIILDVNTMDDYIKIKRIYDNLYPKNPNFTTVDVINFLDKGI
jgi:spore coat polysaccharide biosynthesis protein SpsF (cytidylyltransferase family)